MADLHYRHRSAPQAENLGQIQTGPWTVNINSTTATLHFFLIISRLTCFIGALVSICLVGNLSKLVNVLGLNKGTLWISAHNHGDAPI